MTFTGKNSKIEKENRQEVEQEMILYIIRHGETDWNKSRKLQGQSDVPLNEFGRHLARETAPALTEISFDIAYTSPLIRAKETASIILEGRTVPIVDEPRLMEIKFGEYEGLCCSQEGWNIPDADFQSFFEAPEKYRAPKRGESFYQFSNRLEDFLTELFRNPDLTDKTVLLSTHGAALCGIIRLIKGLPMEQFWGKGVPKNCAVTIVEVKDQKAVILQERVTYYPDQVEDW